LKQTSNAQRSENASGQSLSLPNPVGLEGDNGYSSVGGVVLDKNGHISVTTALGGGDD